MYAYIYICMNTFMYVSMDIHLCMFCGCKKLLPSLSVLLACIHSQTHNITRNHPLHETQNKILYNIKRKCDV